MLAEIFERLDQWVTDENNSAGMAGFRLIPKSIFRVVGHIYKGQWVHAVRADTHCIMVSKALKSPKKNKVLLRNYIAHRPPKYFFELCQKYNVDLSSIVKG